MRKLVVPCDGSWPPRGRRFPLRLAGRHALVSATVLLACTGSDPTQLHAPRIASLEIEGPSSLIVHERALFLVKARGPDGEELPLPPGLTWDSSSGTVATVSREGVVTARQRGEVVIGVSVGEVRGELAVGVRHRVRISPAYRYRPCYSCDEAHRVASGTFEPEGTDWRIAIGDTLRFVASHVDVNGIVLQDDVPATWTSSDPATVGVSAPGTVVGVSPVGIGADVVATTADGAGMTHVSVSDAIAGLPAMLRLAHAAVAAGPITFVFNEIAPVTLSFGESIDLPISSGLFHVDIQGSPSPDFPLAPFRSFAAIVREEDRLAIYAVGFADAFLTGVWDRPTHVPDGSVRVRLLQGGTSAGVVYVLPPDAPPELPQLCYFDPLDSWGYVELPAGDVDFVMQPKYGDPYQVRFRASPEPGSSVTYVITESAQDPVNILAFVDH